VAAHVADCSPGVRKVLKSLWEVEAMSPGVADHITLGIAARASLVAVHVAVEASAGTSRMGARGGLFSWVRKILAPRRTRVSETQTGGGVEGGCDSDL